MGDSVRIGIFGASGYAGMDLVELLKAHPRAQLSFATSNTYVNEMVADTGLRYIPHDEAAVADADAVFLALPHKASAPVARRALDAGKKVLDLSADLRLDTPQRYQEWYNEPHPHPELLPTPYGLPEINRDNLRGVDRVAVPGCYPTTTLLGLYPLLKGDFIAREAPVIVDAKSGVSGAGRTPKPHLHFVEAYGNLSPYSPGRSHRHVGEIEQEMARLGFGGQLIFVPHLLPVDRGLMASIYVTLNYRITSDKVRGLYQEAYDGERLVQVLPLGEQATLRHVVRQNTCVISLTPVTPQHLHITSVTDNLRKGAASQAIQCFNLMYGFEETLGLT